MFKYLFVDHEVPAMWPQPGRGEVESGCAYDARAPSDLAQDPLEQIISANASPMLLRESIVGERLLHRRFHQLGGPCEM